ncbi:PLP-dependent transferase [Conidiobolus coronatus NRRL 28638]|uniref:PLP-dependent transferase n=1 Tax=Conidiobolus coronatus (strain ATCC 28846 / CBS 209.66 / NRRL 28638) TaxID=796925 RepID=A0A137NUK4_CONC2|nr:PLP-dependent transferase [Conidiobolus coronatus NRRL 28638]|eukprot:KXN66495.1 PLP-dependent transferase [Conidiobolus coronatus NRRL 28638]
MTSSTYQKLELNPKLYRPQDFLIAGGLTHLNTGAYGVVTKQVRDARVEWLNKIESHPDLYVSDKISQLIQETIEPLAKYIGSNPKDVVYVENTTVGVCHILESVGLKKGDVILASSVTYAGIRHTLRKLKETIGIEVVEVDFDFLSDDALVKVFEDTINQVEAKGKKVKLAIIDAITSLPAIIQPYERITRLVQSRGGLALVDAAHAFGQIKINVEELKPDFYITNIHKWGFGFRGQALLYVKPSHQATIENIVATYGYKANTLHEKFEWSGPVDFSKWYSSKSVLDYRKSVGGDEEIYNYNHNLAVLGGEKVAQILGTKVYGERDQLGYMTNILLPVKTEVEPNFPKLLEQYILKNYNIRLRVFSFKNRYYLRLSAQLFLNLKDFELAGLVVKEVLDTKLNQVIANSKL